MRQVSAGVGAVVVGAGLVVMAAGPAHSANVGSVTWTPSGGLSSTLVVGSLNDTFTFSNNDSGSSTVYLINDTGSVSVGGTSCTQQTPGQSLCDFNTGLNPSRTVTITGYGQVGVWYQALRQGYITLSSQGGSETQSSSSTSPAPSSIVQQFAKPTAGSCDAAQPAGLDWSGVANGGWSESWAQWVNGGSGGAVCTRMLVYSSGLSSWSLG